jgi:hypothetical protein
LSYTQYMPPTAAKHLKKQTVNQCDAAVSSQLDRNPYRGAV